MQCPDVRSLLDRYLDGEADQAQQTALARHLGACAGCRAALAARRELNELLAANLAPVPAPEFLAGAIMAHLPPGPAERDLGWWEALRGALGALTALGALASGFLVACLGARDGLAALPAWVQAHLSGTWVRGAGAAARALTAPAGWAESLSGWVRETLVRMDGALYDAASMLAAHRGALGVTSVAALACGLAALALWLGQARKLTEG